MVSLSRYVIMQALFAAASLSNKLFKSWFTDSWLVNRAYFMRKKGKIALSTTKNNFSLSLLPFLLFHILMSEQFRKRSMDFRGC